MSACDKEAKTREQGGHSAAASQVAVDASAAAVWKNKDAQGCANEWSVKGAKQNSLWVFKWGLQYTSIRNLQSPNLWC
ncbi:hypothetical protein L917_15455, partial [Phytophthora nicotianae]